MNCAGLLTFVYQPVLVRNLRLRGFDRSDEFGQNDRICESPRVFVRRSLTRASFGQL